jgi:glycerol-3-phosphate responsive antiterminator
MIQWCEKMGYSIGQLKYWITKCNKLARKSETSEWARVEIVDSNSTAASKITVRVGVDLIEVEPGFDRTVLGEVLRVAASIC